MHFLYSLFTIISVVADDTQKFIVRGSGPLVAPLGSSVVLPCYTETPLVTEKLKVVWRRTDSEIVVHLYVDGESRPEQQDENYHDRAHFFTDQIQHGNFSLRLDNLRAEDKGIYRCKVYSRQVADKTLVEIKDVEYLLVSGSSRSISASVGEDVTLNCSVDSHITPEHIEEVSWKKTDGDEDDILVLLYQNNETSSDAEQYRDRVEFFADETPKGNFSLRLKSVRTEDKGVYICQVFAGDLSANATVVLKRLGFSVSHIMVLILCIASGSTLFFCCKPDMRLYLKASLFLCLNIAMLLASIIWCLIEGSLYETICCCMLYILRPLRSFWVTPSATGFPGKMMKYIMAPRANHAAFMAVMYSVLLDEHFKDIDTAIKTVIFGLLVLMCLLFIIQLAKEKMLSCSGESCRKLYSKVQPFVATCIFSLLPSLQFALLLYTCFASNAVFIVLVLSVPPGLLYFCDGTRWINQCYCYLYKLIWLMTIAMSGTMVYFYIMLLRKEKEGAGLVCVAGILQALWVLAFSEVPVHYLNLHKRKLFFLDLFGSAALVLVNAVALMTEVIMNAVNGERLVGDLRVVVFPSEWLFTVPMLILSMFASWKPEGTQSHVDVQSPDSKGPPSEYISLGVNQRTEQSNEMQTLKEGGNCEEQINS